MINSKKRRSLKSRSLKSRSLKRRSQHMSPKLKMPKILSRSIRRSRDMLSKLKMPKKLRSIKSSSGMSPKLKMPKILSRSIRRSRDMLSNLKMPKRLSRSIKRSRDMLSKLKMPKRLRSIRRQHNMSPKLKMPKLLSRSIRRSRDMLSKLKKIPNRLTRSIRRSVFGKIKKDKKIHSKVYLRGGVFVKCPKCKSQKNDSDTHLVYNRNRMIEERICKKPCKDRTQQQADAENAAIARKQHDAREALLEYNANVRAANPDLEADRLERNRLFEAREQERRAREEEEKKRLADAKEERINQISNTLDLNNTQLYNIFNGDQGETDIFAKAVKKKRKSYIKDWLEINGITDTFSLKRFNNYDPLYSGNVPASIPDYIKEMRKNFKEHSKNKTIRDIQKEIEDTQRILFDPLQDNVVKNNFIGRRILISYRADSINKHTVTAEDFTCSPNSLEIHCTTLKKLESGNSYRNMSFDYPPSNFYGHVTLIIIGDITAAEAHSLYQYRAQPPEGGNIGEATTYQKSDEEKLRHATVYHYGMFNPLDTRISFWVTRRTGHPLYRMQSFQITNGQEPNLADPPNPFYPRHNNVLTLMKEYYLKCIILCPESTVFADNDHGSKLTYKDFTNWGAPIDL